MDKVYKYLNEQMAQARTRVLTATARRAIVEHLVREFNTEHDTRHDPEKTAAAWIGRSSR